MTRNEAITIAAANRKAHKAEDLENMMGRAPDFDAFEKYGHRHGWYHVGEFSFSDEQITGVPYDIAQGGWAYL